METSTLSSGKSIYGLHEGDGAHLMAAHPGWQVETYGLGHDPANPTVINLSRLVEIGVTPIARINHGYGSQGTVPAIYHREGFIDTVKETVRRSVGVHHWIVGNELNHSQERPDGIPITPSYYGTIFNPCASAVHSLPGHENDVMMPAPVAPWNTETTYAENPSGDWLLYSTHLLGVCKGVGGLALHAYTHGFDPSLATSEVMMGPPYGDRHYHFKTYIDSMNVIPESMRSLPVFITECDQYGEWYDSNTGWVRAVYAEINRWNSIPGNQQIHALVLYRYPRIDRWWIQGKTGVENDFVEAVAFGYSVGMTDPCADLRKENEVLRNRLAQVAALVCTEGGNNAYS